MQTINASTNQTDDVHLQLGDDSVSWKEVLSQLQVFGRLKPFLQELASQKVMLEEVRERIDLELDPAELDASITEFRQQRKLTDDDLFKTWLASEQLDYPGFRMRMYFSCKLKRLKQRIAEPELEAEFERQKQSLEQIELSYLICKKEQDAKRFAEELRAGSTSFEALAAQQAANPDVSAKEHATPLTRAWLQEDLRAVLDNASTQELVGPIQKDDRWILARINAVIPAQLDEATENRLSNQLFKRWLQQRLSGYSIRVGP